MRKGDRVYVRWDDIQAQNHTDEELPTAKAELVAWVISAKGKAVQFETCRYMDGTKYKDRITIPKGCIEHWEKI